MVKSIDAVSRAMLVLDVLRVKSPTTLANLHHQTSINKATLLRILKTLQESGWVYRALGDSKYRLSYTLQTITSNIDSSDSIVELATPIIQKLQGEIPWPVDISKRDGLAMKIIETTRPLAAFSLNREVLGVRPPFLYSGIGRAYLAFCPSDEMQEIISGLKSAGGKEGKLAHDQIWLNKLLQQTKDQGYGQREPAFFGTVSNSGQYIEAIAVPVFDQENVTATLSVAWPQGAVGQDEIVNHLYPSLRAGAVQLAKLMKKI
ncbi:IclR family transcriptional regulator domain-containing protein [Neptunomonas qingdaonensis]|uniref:Transcriptional regulator, IclR family n=1 Tax=Neptunomonas qingdaonensis TaxID=1045558 RepID=A0A1I2QL49_9GAMM|nr:IclR family transcriptional regulator C-terminal domain-containing protein [Neptunomonas qingdaonensis]SFG29162.1 transcriptional regulator, IclR family [Neptunomonas qingdaonensis]